MANIKLIYFLHLILNVNSILAQVNIALNKPTLQSSTISNQNTPTSSKAVDNNTSGAFGDGSCTHTYEASTSWWCVDLQNAMTINKTMIFNRNVVPERLQGFEIRLSYDSVCSLTGFQSATLCYTDNAAVQAVYTIENCNQGIQFAGRTVYISVYRNNGKAVVTLCEVQIFAKACETSSTCRNDLCNIRGVCLGCKDGYYGSQCGQLCSNCRLGCRQQSGSCNACVDGHYGTNCDIPCGNGCAGNSQCARATGACTCIDTYYGNTCASSCSDKCQASKCYNKINPSSSTCTIGCANGFKFFNCETRCPVHCISCQRYSNPCITCEAGWYGNSCEYKCSDNCVGSCEKDGGKCTACKSGFIGDFCNLSCNNGCLSNGNQETCDRDGVCALGCIEGRYGQPCDRNCSAVCDDGCDRDSSICNKCVVGKYGYQCNQNCSFTCAGGCNRNTAECNSCIGGTFGDICQNQCSKNCKATMCSRDGTCIGCDDGKSGDMCTTNCNTKCVSCPQDDINKCRKCANGRFGNSCDQICSSSCIGDGSTPICNVTGGACSLGCKEKTHGYQCDKACSAGCQDAVCDQITALCSRGCIAGKQGIECSQDSSEDNTVTLASVAAVVVLVIVVVLVVGLLLRRRMRENKFKGVYTSEPSRAELNIDSSNTPGVTAEEAVKDVTIQVKDVVTIGGDYANISNGAANIYENLDDKIRSPNCIDLKDLLDYIEKKRKVEFKAEFQKLPKDLCQPHDISLGEVNKPKNRYKNICAFDHTRVKLEIEDNDPNSDYVNACYLTTYGDYKKKYIASQGPNNVNINEFLRMIWDVDASKVVMVTNPVENSVTKCLKYWPNDVGGENTTKNIRIKLLKEDIFSHFIVRELQITKEGCGSRKIKHFHYTSWLDKSVPDDKTSLLEFRNKVITSTTERAGPMIVHCSAGIGRTGTFLGLDYLIEEGKAEQSVNVFKYVSQMRNERVNMIQTVEQYTFLHEVLAVWFAIESTSSTVTAYQQMYQKQLEVNKETGKSGLQDTYEFMNKVCSVLNGTEAPQVSDDEDTDRDPQIRTTRTIVDSNNTVNLPSYKMHCGYILTRTPLMNKVGEFWRMVVQSDSNNILYLDDADASTTNIGQYLPYEGMDCEPYKITMTTKEKHASGYFTVITYHITSQSEGDVDRTVRIYRCHFWNTKHKIPDSTNPIFRLLDEVNVWSKTCKTGPIIVQSLNDVDKGGLFCVLASILERLTIEQEVGVVQTIIQLRVHKPQIITCYEQFKFCFDAVGEYLDNFSIYANSC